MDLDPRTIGWIRIREQLNGSTSENNLMDLDPRTIEWIRIREQLNGSGSDNNLLIRIREQFN